MKGSGLGQASATAPDLARNGILGGTLRQLVISSTVV